MKKYRQKEIELTIKACKTADDIENLFACCENESEIFKISVLFKEFVRRNEISENLLEFVKKIGLLRMLEITDKL